MKLVTACALLIASVLAEPPVDNRYLPPSQNYGPPDSGVFGARGPNGFRSSSRFPSTRFGSSFGAPHGALSAQYGAPQVTLNSQFGNAPSTQYGAPEAPTAKYGPPQSSPAILYGAPRDGFGPQLSGQRVNGADFSDLQSRHYLPPGTGRDGYGAEEANGEPAKYSFEYMVKDEYSGNDFGHHETRLGDRAEGVYYVVLPDGRKQTVEYEADQDGYKPRISYEDTGLGAFRSGQGYVNGGYSQDGPY